MRRHLSGCMDLCLIQRLKNVLWQRVFLRCICNWSLQNWSLLWMLREDIQLFEMFLISNVRKSKPVNLSIQLEFWKGVRRRYKNFWKMRYFLKFWRKKWNLTCIWKGYPYNRFVLFYYLLNNDRRKYFWSCRTAES